MDLTPWNGTPRWLQRVSPDSANLASLTDEAATPASWISSSTVRCGCHSSGTTGWSQRRELSRSPVAGTRLVYPTMPCSPARRPVPSDVRLVAVVDGTPQTTSSMPCSEDRNGAEAALSRSSVVPRPSRTITTNRGASGRPRTSVKPGTPSAPPTDGSSSSSVCRPRGPYDDAARSGRRHQGCAVRMAVIRRDRPRWPGWWPRTGSGRSRAAGALQHRRRRPCSGAARSRRR